MERGGGLGGCYGIDGEDRGVVKRGGGAWCTDPPPIL